MSNIQNQELFQIFETEVNGILIKTVNARELHSFLDIQTKFATWISNRISKYSFEENHDYLTVSKNLENGGRSIEYNITLDMAKELSMVENNEQGRLARRYFIECSNKADKVLKLLYSLEYQPKTDLLYLKDNSYVTDSLILSNLVGKHHYHILRDIEFEISSLEENPNLDAPIKSSILNGFYKDTYLSVQGKELPKYVLNEEAALQVLLKYSSELRARFIVAFKQARETIFNIIRLKELESVLPELNTNSSFVYIIKNMDTNNIKIGVSKDVYKRLETFRTGNDCQLELVYKSILCSNAFDIESNIHKEFKKYHIRGEWFNTDVKSAIEYLEKARYVLNSSLIDVNGNKIFERITNETND